MAGLQGVDGAWQGEVVWSPMITAQMVIARAIVGRMGDAAWCKGIRRHVEATRNVDGGWALDPVSASCLFVTSLVYVALRLMGEPADGPLGGPAREWLANHREGLLAIPSWGKLWLSFVGLYSYDGVNPVPPELFLLPRWSPLHPSHFNCHVRYVYLGFAYLYGRRFRADLGPVAARLREELHAAPFDRIDFAAGRHRIARTDLHEAPGPILRCVSDALRLAGRAGRRLRIAAPLRARALRRCLALIRGEIAATAGQCLSPVNGILNLVALHANDPSDPAIDSFVAQLERWRWEDEESGIRYAGARSQCWDTALGLRALDAALAPPAAAPCPVVAAMRAGYDYLSRHQCLGEPAALNPDRLPTTGGWCFCDVSHRWPVSDCTAEAVSAILACHETPGLIDAGRRLGSDRLAAAARFILARRNGDGGFGAYEPRRGPRWLARVNPSEMFGRCMTERSYVECTASCLEALALLDRHLASGGERVDVSIAIREAIRFLRRTQRTDGSWPGFWGINFIYATSFVLRGLAAAGVPRSDPAVRRAVDWLKRTQLPDGGWGEHPSGLRARAYVANDRSLTSSTSWALLGLLEFEEGAGPAARSAARWLANRRLPDGTWPRESVNGAFFDSCAIEYTLYNTIFSTWALGRWRQLSARDRPFAVDEYSSIG